MLLQIHNYIGKHGQVSLLQLQREFSIEAEALKPMLDFLEQKGYVKPIESVAKNCASACTGCSCGPVIYRASKSI